MKPKPERRLAETAKSLRIFSIVGICRRHFVWVVGGRQQRVPEAPPVVYGHPPETVFDGLLGVLRLIGHRGDVVEHLNRLGPLGDTLLKAFVQCLDLFLGPLALSDVQSVNARTLAFLHVVDRLLIAVVTHPHLTDAASCGAVAERADHGLPVEQPRMCTFALFEIREQLLSGGVDEGNVSIPVDLDDRKRAEPRERGQS